MSSPNTTAEHGRQRAQREYDALPEWAKKMVLACAHAVQFGGGMPDHFFSGSGKKKSDYHAFNVVFERAGAENEWFSGFCGMNELGNALTAPWPPAPAPEMISSAGVNLVEMVDDEQAFDQPCAFGNRCGGHAVYCHNEAWPNAPRKCRRTWYTGGKTRDEDCPGYTPNPEYKGAP